MTDRVIVNGRASAQGRVCELLVFRLDGKPGAFTDEAERVAGFLRENLCQQTLEELRRRLASDVCVPR